jgi:hypothetical protein
MSRDNIINIGGGVSQASIIAGDNNQVKQSVRARTNDDRQLGIEELQRSLGEIRTLLANLSAPDRPKLDRALADAADEAAKADPDKTEVAGALQRAVKYAKAAENIGEVAAQLQGPLTTIAGWVGVAVPAAARLFGLSL